MRLHTTKLTEFLGRNDCIILSTHDPADADGLGAQMVFTCILRDQGKDVRIINASATPEHFRCMDPRGIIEVWDNERHGNLPEHTAMILVDTADEHTTGQMKDAVCRSKEVFVIDHHEPLPNATLSGIVDSSSASTCEIMVELAEHFGTVLDPHTAFAAYLGIAYDTGFFAYPKTGPRTFHAALTLLKQGVNPNDVYQKLHENGSLGALLLQRKAISSMTFHCNNRVAVQVLRLEDFAEAGALQEETEGLVNIPLRAREIIVSVLFKESPEGRVRCSLRSKGKVNVARVAQAFNGGGHINAAGLKSDMDTDMIMTAVLAHIAKAITEALEQP